jgi:ABC-2 type transport system permease protein
MIGRVAAIITKELRQLLRDKAMVITLLISPLLQLALFAAAATTDLHHIATAVLDRDHSQTTRELTSRFTGSTLFDVVATPATDHEAEAALDRGKARVLLIYPAGFEAALLAGKTPTMLVAADGTDTTAAGFTLGYAQQIAAAFAAERGEAIAVRRGARRAGGGMDAAPRTWFNANLESSLFYIPTLIAQVLLSVTLMLTAMAVVREREIGTLEQLLVTPIRPIELVLGKTLPFALIGMVESLLGLVVVRYGYHVPMRGSIWIYAMASGLFMLTALSMGLLISTVSRTQQQAMMGAFLFLLPANMLSGFMFPIANMPPAAQVLTYINPIRYMNEILRAVFLMGVGLEVLWPNLAALAVLGVTAVVAAVWRFRVTLA